MPLASKPNSSTMWPKLRCASASEYASSPNRLRERLVRRSASATPTSTASAPATSRRSRPGAGAPGPLGSPGLGATGGETELMRASSELRDRDDHADQDEDDDRNLHPDPGW